MPTELNSALAKINSLKLSVINTIMELRQAADEATARGDHQLGRDLDLKAAELAKNAVEIRRAEDHVRAQAGLSAAIANLNDITGEAKRSLAAIRRGADLLGNAAALLRILANLSTVFT